MTREKWFRVLVNIIAAATILYAIDCIMQEVGR
jgi:preprotein translocase subunit SecE